MHRNSFLKLALMSLVLAAGLAILGAAAASIGSSSYPSVSLQARQNGPLTPGVDLVIQSISVEPAVPDVGQPCTLVVVVKNQGDTASAGFRTYLYVDPVDQPPDPGTPDTSWTYFFSLAPNQTFTWRYEEYAFTTGGCGHQVYAWVDRDDDVVEDDETNNLSSTEVCVGATPTPSPTPTNTPTASPTPCVPDEYEPDNACAAAKALGTDGVHQVRNLCPEGDVDWVKFTANAGISYTIETSAVAEDGDTALALYSACGTSPLASDDPAGGTVARIVWYCATSGEYYARVKHHSATYGPAAGYDLSITANTHCPEDVYENDNSCTAARDIATDGTAQTHIFCAASDHDWVKVKVTSGSTVILSTDNLGPDADPMLSIYDSCDAPLSLGHAQQLEWIAPDDTIYYLKLENRDSEVYGPSTNYDLAVTTLGCDGDAYEFDGGDDAAGQARLVQTNKAGETHNICPAGDEDWFKFEAVAGGDYVVDTFHLGLAADTHLCLYEPDGATEIVCDDDGSLTKAARITWTCPADGTYYVQARHFDPTASGPTTAYDLQITTGFHVDGYEPDDGYERASPLSTDGTSQLHNFTPAGDEDWVKFSATAGDYALQTSNLEPGCDTIMELYDTDGTTLLAESDDFAFGLGSRILYTIPAAGTYYARVRNYHPSRFGTNMQYELLAVKGTPPPAPTPPPLATPTPPPAPPPSSVKTLILVNRERMRTVYGADLANQLMNKLVALASHPRVLGNLVQVETDAAVAAAYTDWIADPLDTDLANDVASAVRNLVLAYLDNNPNTEYIVIVGSDEIIPFRRTLDRTSHPESAYTFYVSSNTTIWAACADDMSLTDNYYADREPTVWDGHELYVPDYALGRLIETPEEIMGLIDIFLAGSTLAPSRALITGYDFVQDAAVEICGLLGTDLGDAAVDCALIGEAWNGAELRTKQLDTVPRFDVQSINGHAGKSVEGAPQPPSVKASEIAVLGSSDLSRALVYTLGCHSGLNDTGALPGGLDLAQAFAQRGASYVANTGYGWGLGNNEIGLSERLMHNFTQSLLKGGSARLGAALTTAKQRYYAEAATFDDYDEKILIESTLYGLPMYEIQTGAALEEDPFPSVVLTSGLSVAGDGLTTEHLNLSLAQSFGSLNETEIADGTFFDLDGHVHLAAGEPIQPKFFAEVSLSDAGQPHGVILTSGRYRDGAAFDPVVLQPINEYYSPTVEPPFDAPGWYPPLPFDFHNADSVAGAQTLVATMGQYHSGQQVERLYDQMSFEVFYSSSYDWWEPIILSVDGVLSDGQAQIKVEAMDSSGVDRVVVVYTAGPGIQLSAELAYDADTLKWLANIPATAGTTFYVQVVDGAGNVATADNKGAWYSLGSGASRVYLPIVTKK